MSAKAFGYRIADGLRGRTGSTARKIIVAWCAVAMLADWNSSAAAQKLSQFGHSAWRTQDGLFASPNTIAQTSDGYIWIGTDRGLTRFDGVRFVLSNAATGFPISEFKVTALMGARDGSLWVGARQKVSNVKDGVASHYKVPFIPAQLVEDVDGTAWLVETRGAGGQPICHLANKTTECDGPPTVPLRHAAVLAGDSATGFWIGSSSGLCHWYPGKGPAECFLQETLEPFAGLDGVTSVLRARDGSLWVGIGRPGPGLGLGRLSNGVWQPFVAENLDGEKLSVSSLMEDREGAIWVGTYDQGIYRLHQGQVDHYRSEDGLSSNDVIKNGIFEDREGIVWVLTSAGIDAFRHQRVSAFSIREGLPSDSVESVLAMRNGDIWLGNAALSILRNDHNIRPDDAELFADRAVTSLLEDREGNVWIGLDKTLQIYRDGKLTEVLGLDGKSLGIVVNLAQDTVGDVWISTTADNQKVVRARDRKVVEQMKPDQFGNPTTLVSDPGGGIWIGSGDGRIASYKDGRFTVIPPEIINRADVRHMFVDAGGTVFAATSAGLLILGKAGGEFLTAAKGLPCDSLGIVVQDKRGALWLSGSCGLMKIEGAELKRWVNAPNGNIRVLLLDSTHGVQSGVPSFSPHASVAPDGRVWFATGRFAQVVDPADDIAAARSTPVQIEELTADRKIFAPSASITLPAASRDISVRYTALTFLSAQKTQFQSMLEGRDVAWENVGTRREAFYTDLPPGAYVFRVKARSADGTWGEESAALNFEIPPLFHQTRWFLALCVIAVFLIAYALFIMRLHQVASRFRQQMRVKMMERERIARDLHDTLLQDTQALILSFQTVADQMSAGDPARRMMERTLDKADKVLAEGRECVHELRDPEAKSMDLPEALSRVGDELATMGVSTFRTIVEGQQRQLTSSVRDEAYRIGREALINAFHHAQADNIELQISYGVDTLVVQIRDDGKGIDPATLETGRKAGHWGLVGMQERARGLGGKLDIWSGSKPGTEVQLEVPAEVAYWTFDSRATSWLSRLGFKPRPL